MIGLGCFILWLWTFLLSMLFLSSELLFKNFLKSFMLKMRYDPWLPAHTEEQANTNLHACGWVLLPVDFTIKLSGQIVALGEDPYGCIAGSFLLVWSNPSERLLPREWSPSSHCSETPLGKKTREVVVCNIRFVDLQTSGFLYRSLATDKTLCYPV